MQWRELIKSESVVSAGGEGNPRIVDIVLDSRTVTPGALFVAIPGFRVQGDQFISQAVDNGAAAVVSVNAHPGCPVPWIQVSDVRKTMSNCAMRLWNINFNDMLTVGITGTNGKTTVTQLYATLFDIVYGRQWSWALGTIGYRMGEQTADASQTTPECVEILRRIGKAEQKPRALSMEVSSHALELQRIDNFVYNVAVFTNLTQDHLDFHGTMESYFLSKRKLFLHYMKPDGIAVINIDDPWGEKLSSQCTNTTVVTFGYADKASVKIEYAECTWEKTVVTVLYNNERMRFESSLVADFNVYNMAALIAGALKLNYTPAIIQQSFDSIKGVPGRMERVAVDTPYTVIVDYAHTPDALANVLATAKKLTKGRVSCVFGCGGDRDKTKRPRMAEAAARLCDEAFVTSDNPRSEQPEKIIEDIVQGIPLDFPYSVIPDRKKAIKAALQTAQYGDSIIVAGKGHETYQEINGVRNHFDDREMVTTLVQEIEAERKK